MEPIRVAIDRLADKMETLKDLRQTESDLEIFDEARREVNARRDRLKHAVDAHLVLVAVQEEPSIPKELGKEAMATIEGLEEVLSVAPLRFKRSKHYAGTLSSVDRVVKELKNAHDNGWHEYRERLPQADGGSRAVMEAIPGAEADVRALKAAFAELDKMQKPPASIEELRELEAIVAKIHELNEKFASYDLPEDVRRFLAAARGPGANLKHLTAEVRSWLEEHDLLDGLVLRFKPTLGS